MCRRHRGRRRRWPPTEPGRADRPPRHPPTMSSCRPEPTTKSRSELSLNSAPPASTSTLGTLPRLSFWRSLFCCASKGRKPFVSRSSLACGSGEGLLRGLAYWLNTELRIRSCVPVLLRSLFELRHCVVGLQSGAGGGRRRADEVPTMFGEKVLTIAPDGRCIGARLDPLCMG